MTTDDLDGHFYIGYDPRNRLFKVHAYRSPHQVFRTIAVGDSLDDLLNDCKKMGLTYFEGLTREAATVIHEWLTYLPQCSTSNSCVEVQLLQGVDPWALISHRSKTKIEQKNSGTAD